VCFKNIVLCKVGPFFKIGSIEEGSGAGAAISPIAAAPTPVQKYKLSSGSGFLILAPTPGKTPSTSGTPGTAPDSGSAALDNDIGGMCM